MTAEGLSFKQRVEDLLHEALAEKPGLFLIDLKVSASQAIHIILDGDDGVNLQDCMDVSRAVEHSLDREETDFSLEVSSAGAASPLIIPRQYKQHIGRKIHVFYSGQDIEGTLEEADSENIVLSWKAREPKPIGKGKHTIRKEVKIPFSEIEKATVVLKF
jgi:ribosome maturation factor RimP